LGEIFHRIRPPHALAWTGERLVTDIGGAIEAEHFHRYFLARELCRGKCVLDVASGEGYGTALLAQTANYVVGIEVDRGSVEHAANTYRHDNLLFVQGEATKLPIDTASVDVVVSFETLEHFFDHEAFLVEVRRILAPNGLLIISTPDVDTYSSVCRPPNQFHVRELNRQEFLTELQGTFSNVNLFHQRAIVGSAVLAESQSSGFPYKAVNFEQRDEVTFQSDSRLPRAPYLIALASMSAVPEFAASVFVQGDNPGCDPSSATKAEIERLRAIERESSILRTRTEALEASLRSAESATVSLLNESQTREANLKQQLENLRERETSLHEQLEASALLLRQQSIAGQRFRQEVVSCKETQVATATELDATKAELNQAKRSLDEAKRSLDEAKKRILELEIGYKEICGLVFPIWMRKLLPAPLKNLFRNLKRTLRQR